MKGENRGSMIEQSSQAEKRDARKKLAGPSQQTAAHPTFVSTTRVDS
jgi:hypothetical protein